MTRRHHKLKTHPDEFAATWDRQKLFEVRADFGDRNYQVGDILLLCEWDPDTELYTGRELQTIITAMVCGPAWGLPVGIHVLGFQFTSRTPKEGE